LAEVSEDPREVAWHPRHAAKVIGHEAARAAFAEAFESGRPHHAWLLSGPKGIGKASFAYSIAKGLLAGNNAARSDSWIAARSHPGLFVLERSLNDSKPRRLRQEISVDDARRMSEFFARTSANGGWRTALVDCADDLNTEAGNALLKLVEEPPPKSLILIISNQPGRVLRTLRSRCRRLPMARLSDTQVASVLEALPLEKPLTGEKLQRVISQCGGAPGAALDLAESGGASAFEKFRALRQISPGAKADLSQLFAQRQKAVEDFPVFVDLLLAWLAAEAEKEPASGRGAALAQAHAVISARKVVVEGYNLDRRAAVVQALTAIEDALKAA
jgi:DNA polymerase-3 subunit delta'